MASAWNPVAERGHLPIGDAEDREVFARVGFREEPADPALGYAVFPSDRGEPPAGLEQLLVPPVARPIDLTMCS